MTSRLKLMNKLVDARRRLRDAAAAAHAKAENDRLRAKQHHDNANAELTGLIDDAAVRMTSAKSVDELIRFDAERLLSMHIVSKTKQSLDAAAVESDRKMGALRERTRSLRSSEKIREKEQKEIRTSEQKDEQKHADDLSSSKNTRST